MTETAAHIEQPRRNRANSLRAAAEILSVTHRTIQRKVASGQIRVIRIGSRVLITDAEIDRILKEGV